MVDPEASPSHTLYVICSNGLIGNLQYNVNVYVICTG